MLKIDWSFVGEWVFIFSFCILYGVIANVQSRMFPAEGARAVKVRKVVDFETSRLGQKHLCEDQAPQWQKSEAALIWYENSETHEYWCGLLELDELTEERLMELAPYIEILNSGP